MAIAPITEAVARNWNDLRFSVGQCSGHTDAVVVDWALARLLGSLAIKQLLAISLKVNAMVRHRSSSNQSRVREYRPRRG
jgi:hypothetical protein